MNVLPTVWAIGALLIVLLCGVVARLTGLIPISAIGPYNKLIFTFGIPCLAFNAMATHSVQTLDWGFVLIFLAIRAVAALIAAIYTIATRGNFGDFVVHYLAPTWIDVITFGIPIISVMFSPAIGAHYPVLAAFSSFLFELPLVLICFEIFRARSARRNHCKQLKDAEEKEGTNNNNNDTNNNNSNNNANNNDNSNDNNNDNNDDNNNGDNGSDCTSKKRKSVGAAGSLEEGFISENEKEENEGRELKDKSGGDSQVKMEYVEESTGAQARRIALFVGKRLLQTPPIIAIVLGLIYGSIQIAVPDILAKVISYLGGLVTPIASFSVGMFVCDGQPFKRAWRKTIVYMLLKVFAMPLLALLIVYVAGIENPAAEVAVIIASLPLAFPAFTITKQYGVGEDVMSTCVTTGTILMLPVVLFWWWVVEAIDIFPNPPAPAPAFNSSSYSYSSSYSSF